MVSCPSCGTEVQPDWDWCHACGWDPDAQLPATTGAAHPEVLRTELVPLERDRRPAAAGATSSSTAGTARPRAGSPGGSGYTPKPNRTVPIVAAAGGVAVVVVLLAVVLLGGGGDPAPVTTADRTPSSFTTTTKLAVTPWALPEGGFKVDLPTALAPTTAPDVPAPFLTGVAYTGALDGREYLVASLEVHPAYKWEDIGRAMIDAEEVLGAQHGFAVTGRTAGAFKEMSSSRFTVVAAQGPTETEADFAARKDAAPTGEGIALVTGNHLYVVLVKGTSLAQAQFPTVLESIVVV